MQLENVNQGGLLCKNSLCNHLLDDALLLLTQQEYRGATGTANETRSTMGQGKDLPCAAYKANDPEMDGSTNTPKMRSPSLLQVSAEPMSLPLLPWQAAHHVEGAHPGLHLLAG